MKSKRVRKYTPIHSAGLKNKKDINQFSTLCFFVITNKANQILALKKIQKRSTRQFFCKKLVPKYQNPHQIDPFASCHFLLLFSIFNGQRVLEFVKEVIIK